MNFKNCIFTIVLLTGSLSSTRSFAQESTDPLWSHVPETVSPQWGEFIREIGKERQKSVPTPDDIDSWKAIQTASDKEKEAKADKFAELFGAHYEETTIAGIPVVKVTPSKIVTKNKIGVYTHGGAYVFNSAKAVIQSPMLFASRTGLEVIAIDYTLAPHSKWQKTTDEVVAVFKELARQGFAPGDIVLFGDSAGGGLAAGATLKMRNLGMDLPGALILWSPWADISETGDTYATLRDAEPYYTYENLLGPSALAYADPKDHKHPYVSPVYGDFSKGFPPTLIQGGTKEIFLSNFVRLYQALDQAGQNVKLDIYEGMPHVFVPMLPDTPESKAAMTKANDWVTKHLLQKETK